MLKNVIRKTVFIYSIFGLIIGIGLLIASFFTNEIVLQSGEKIFASGIKAGLIGVPACILIAVFIGVMHAIFCGFQLYIFTRN